MIGVVSIGLSLPIGVVGFGLVLWLVVCMLFPLYLVFWGFAYWLTDLFVCGFNWLCVTIAFDCYFKDVGVICDFVSTLFVLIVYLLLT